MAAFERPPTSPENTDPAEPTSVPTNVTHHLMRVRIRTNTFDRLAEIARAESRRSGDHTTVSDLVRAALADYITVYDSTTKLAFFQSDPMRKPLG